MRKVVWLLLLYTFFLIGCNEQPIGKHSSEQSNDKEQVETFNKETSGQLAVHYIDVGQADATLFHYTNKNEEYVVLYDVGDWQGNEVIHFLQKQNIDHIHIIIVSHPHADHIGQLEKILHQFSVDEVWMSGNTTNTDLFHSAMNALLESSAKYYEPTAGDIFDIGPIELLFLHPEKLTGDLNDDSLSMKVTYNDISFMFTGDASKKAERFMLERGEKMNATILALGHHGSDTSSDPSFVRAVRPDYAIYSAGVGNSYGHPSKDVLQLLDKENIPVLGTDQFGTITIITDGASYHISSEKNIDKTEKTKEFDKEKTACIDINSASKEELQTIVHIGESRADEVIKRRPFTSLDDLQQVNGIGAARLVEIKAENKACVGGTKE